MTEQAVCADDIRTRILQEPHVILEDPDVMRALIAADDQSTGANVIDLRGVAIGRLEDRLQRLEVTHQSVIAAAYETLSGTAQVHRAVVALLGPLEFEEFLNCLQSEVPQILNIAQICLVLESQEALGDELAHVEGVLSVVRPGFVGEHISAGQPLRRVHMRQGNSVSKRVMSDAAQLIKSEACLLLDFGEGRFPGMLVLSSENEAHFAPNQGTDLLEFMGAVFERAMRRWLG